MSDWTIAHGDALSVLEMLPGGIAQCVVTSPPYYGLRDYGNAPLTWPAVSYAPMPGLPELHFPGDPECEHEWGELPTKRNRWGVDKDVSDKQASNRGNAYEIGQGAHCQRCGAWRGNLGLEPTPEMFIAHLVAIFREVRRVLADTGVAWVNMGDSYSGGGGAWPGAPSTENTKSGQRALQGATTMYKGRQPAANLKPKDLMLIPARLALALQADGWWLRSDVIWHKGNPMPESVTDRPTKSHEHIFLLANSERYFYDAQAIAEPLARPEEGQRSTPARFGGAEKYSEAQKQSRLHSGNEYLGTPTGTRNRRDVWTINTVPFKQAHFAVFAPSIPEICIKAGTSERGQCPHCGAPWERVVEKRPAENPAGYNGSTFTNGKSAAPRANVGQGTRYETVDTTGWRPTCECPDHEPVPQLVVDPFSGAGTTGLVATRLGRRYIGIEPNSEYVQMSKRRILDDAPLLNAPALAWGLEDA